MKRDFLRSLNIEALTDDIITQIMDEAGKDIEKNKKQAEDWQTKYNDVESKLKKFDGVNIEEYQGKIKALSDEISANKLAYETEKAESAFEAWKNENLAATGAKNKKAYAALFDWDALKKSTNRDTDFSTMNETLKKENSFMFDDGNPNREADKQMPPTGNGGTPDNKDPFQAKLDKYKKNASAGAGDAMISQ